MRCVWLGSVTLMSGLASSEADVKELDVMLRRSELYRDVVVLTRLERVER